jgi:pimeloyl-ACP methyl ester carboxylesterase
MRSKDNERLQEGTFDTGEINLHYVQWTGDAASGAPLILLHGTTQSWRDWALVAEAIAAGRPVFAIDARGHGRSGRVPNGYRLVDFPRDQQAFLREAEREPAVLVGHSLGALNAIYIAAETPELVRTIVLEDPPLYVNERGLGDFAALFRELKALDESNLGLDALAAKVAEDSRVSPAAARPRAEWLAQADPQTLGQVLDGLAYEGWDTDTLLVRITCPVLLLVGEAKLGSALKPVEAVRAERKLANGRIAFIEHGGHRLHGERPEAFLSAVREFLQSLEENVDMEQPRAQT